MKVMCRCDCQSVAGLVKEAWPQSQKKKYKHLLKKEKKKVNQAAAYQNRDPSTLLSTSLWKCKVAMMKAIIQVPYSQTKINT